MKIILKYFQNRGDTVLNKIQFSRIIKRYNCDNDVLSQIREFIISSMIPDEDVIMNHSIVALPDRSKRLLNRPRQTRYFDVLFYVMYYQIGRSFVGEPILEITVDAAEGVDHE